MIALLQRVSEACVRVEGKVVAHIGRGVTVFVGIERGDTERMAERILSYRVFPDGTLNLLLRRGKA